jgi:transcriptional regulator with XRE-family HTH domain
METTGQQRRQLALFLRSRRGRITPEEAGVRNASARRRTRGLRREELAELAGVSLTWYTWLEQGRSIRVSRQVLNSLGRALRLDPAETEHLFRLAGEVPPISHRLAGLEDIAPSYLSLLESLDPLPAAITNSRFDVLAWNEGYCVIYPDFENLVPAERNILHMIFDERIRALFPEWEEYAFQLIGFFRSNNAERLASPEYTEIVENLSRRFPEFSAFWGRMDLTLGHPASTRLDHPVLGHVELGYTKLRLVGPDATLYVHQPATDADALKHRLARLVEQRARKRLMASVS